ncbi:2-5A-dependent ribonuclease [Pezoporus wallicus]|uniref:2-5A-dependent ribonuclease n=1 Tax=Pezoporus wallicus TaxID=35540 RepID=UPI00254D5610|nr:2-5A-dependent ribonuclease [Pezoporus wallicus]XP_061307941.1 2-5A-dependent ribonuclease [Pezoporus flaviventris]
MDCKGALRMIFQAVRELHSLGFAHQDLHPSNFLIDLGGKIYLADFNNKRRLIEDKQELVNSDLEALSSLVLYVLTWGRKPLQQVSAEDLVADSPDYKEALDLINRDVLNIMENPKKGRSFKYSNNVSDLLRFIRNLNEHPDIRLSNKIGDNAEYFLKLFPALTIYVYNSLCQNPEYSHFADIQYSFL